MRNASSGLQQRGAARYCQRFAVSLDMGGTEGEAPEPSAATSRRATAGREGTEPAARTHAAPSGTTEPVPMEHPHPALPNPPLAGCHGHDVSPRHAPGSTAATSPLRPGLALGRLSPGTSGERDPGAA